MPQWLVLVRISTQLPQSVRPLEQPACFGLHSPRSQISLAPQTLPHAAQLAETRSTQVPLHRIWLAGQFVTWEGDTEGLQPLETNTPKTSNSKAPQACISPNFSKHAANPAPLEDPNPGLFFATPLSIAHHQVAPIRTRLAKPRSDCGPDRRAPARRRAQGNRKRSSLVPNPGRQLPVFLPLSRR